MAILWAFYTFSILIERGLRRACFTLFAFFIPHKLILASNAFFILNVGSLRWAHTFVVFPVINKCFWAGSTGFHAFIPKLEGLTLNTFLAIPVREAFRAITGWICILLLVEELRSRPTHEQEQTECDLDSHDPMILFDSNKRYWDSRVLNF